MPIPPLTPAQRVSWNKFIDYVQSQKVNPATLDQRNKQIGLGLLQKFNMTNPKDALPMEVIPQVQQDLQDYRNKIIGQWKAGKISSDGVKTEADIMPSISPVDGWPGSRTLSSKYPTASTTTVNGNVIKYGTDVDAFDRDNGLAANK